MHRVFAAPLVLTSILALLSLLPRIQSNAALVYSLWAATAVLAVWHGVLYWQLRNSSATRTLTVTLRPGHYLQALVQASVFLYWGWHWRPVYDHAWLLVAQLVFAYAFDMLLAWSRRERYVLGFGPFPIVLSTNLFLWFRDDWFGCQFLMLAVGFMGKEFVRWRRDGRSTHIFNPSAFSLGLFSLVLIATGATGLTWGEDIASTLTLAPNIYLFLFAAGLVVMYFFSVTLVAGSAAIVLFGLSALHSAVTGVPYFLDSEIPTAVFLGLHLLVTDPSTSPRTPRGKVVFGVLYGLGVFAMYWVLGALGVPTFYDKLLCVPLLNLSVQTIDRVVQRAARSARVMSVAPNNLAHITLWVLFFGVMTVIGATDGRHTGDSLPFWENACADGKGNACERLVQIEASYCRDNSGWACNELGVHFAQGLTVRRDTDLSLEYFSRACELRLQAACFSVLDLTGATGVEPTPDHTGATGVEPTVLDLRLLLREGGHNLTEMSEPDLYTRACAHGWTFACDRVSR